MNAIIKTLMSGLVLICLSLASCGGADYKNIDKKIEEEGVFADFSEKEYSAMLDYVEEYIEKQLSKADKIYDFENEQDMQEWQEDLDEAFGQGFDYLAALSLAEEEGKLNSNDSKRYNNIKTKLNQFIQRPTNMN